MYQIDGRFNHHPLINEQLVASTAMWMVSNSTVIRIMNGFLIKLNDLCWRDVSWKQIGSFSIKRRLDDLLLENIKP